MGLLCAIISTFLYATQGTLLDLKLRMYTPSAVVLLLYAGMAPTAMIHLLCLRLSNQQISSPPGTLLPMILLIGVAYYGADFFFVKALSLNTGIVVVGSVLLLVPVISAVMKGIIAHKWPNTWIVVGFLGIVLSIVAMQRGLDVAGVDSSPHIQPEASP